MKQQANIIIFGNLIAKQIGGGGNIFSAPSEESLEASFETDEAVIIQGNLLTDQFHAGQQVVVVVGQVLQKGGGHE